MASQAYHVKGLVKAGEEVVGEACLKQLRPFSFAEDLRSITIFGQTAPQPLRDETKMYYRINDWHKILHKGLMRMHPNSIAYKIVEVGKELGLEFSPRRLQKILYYCHGWHHAMFDEPFIDEKFFFETWELGPVLKEVREHFKPGSTWERISEVINVPGEYQDNFSKDQIMLIKWVVSWARKYNDVQLTELTHRPGTPWEITMKKAKSSRDNLLISHKLIYQYFDEQAAKFTVIPEEKLVRDHNTAGENP
ncbi:Panacea domain-containing protein [Lacibacterium aquatile]|uniref:Panacea domain-containing protein n=1 Tax=Lacibacterium aquatile TaxID=1168082 RepID=A0ABW5DVB9_9PROT